jgi:hypothetical protein
MIGPTDAFFYNHYWSQSTTAPSPIHPPHKSPGHVKSSQSSLVLSWQRIYNSLTVTTAHIKSSFRRLTPLYAFVPILYFHNSDLIRFCTTYIASRWTHRKHIVAPQWIYANHIQNTASSVVFTARCIATEIIRWLHAYSSSRIVVDYLAMGCLPRICLRGNAFIEPLPSSGSIRHNMYMCPVPNGFRDTSCFTVHSTDEQHAMSSHELQSALMLTVEFSKMYCTR